MASCNGTTQLYCAPEAGGTIFENQTYALDYNAQFSTLDGQTAVDVFLYHADNSSLAERFLDIPNNGEMTFTVADV